jgi:hypothetical protein
MGPTVTPRVGMSSRLSEAAVLLKDNNDPFLKPSPLPGVAAYKAN